MENLPTNIGISTTKPPMNNDKLNDIGFRVILIPFFGIAIPLITGMIDYESFTQWKTKFSFLYTIGIAFVIWQGNRYLLFTLRSYFNWFNKPIRKIIALLFKFDKTIQDQAFVVFTDYYKAMDKLREGLPQGERPERTEVEKLSADRDEKLKKVLTEDQFKKFKDEIEPALRPRRRQG